MSDKNPTTEKGNVPSQDVSESQDSPENEVGKNSAMNEPAANAEKADETAESVSKGALLILVIIVASLAWYLVSDRFAPYTTQARVQGYVIGVAPKVSGLVTKMHIKDNQQVKAKQLLFEIDTSKYDIALSKARSDLESAQRRLSAASAQAGLTSEITF